MATETVSAADRLRLYQSRHTIQQMSINEIASGRDLYCAVDGIRILPVKGGRWRHHPDEIVKLMDAVYGGSWARRDKAVERVVETIPEDLDEDEDMDGWREGQPEFNGSFR